MPTYTYRVKKEPARIIRGKIEAESEGVAVGRLKEMGYFPVSVVEQKEGELKSEISFRALRPIRSQDVTIFTRQLSNLLGAGMPLVNSLSTLLGQTENPKLIRVIEDLRNSIQAGSTFSEALSKYPKVFSLLYTGMVHAGESGGMLEEVLERLTDFAEKQEEIKGKIRAAMTYPLLLVFVGVITVFALLTFVLPKFVVMFHDLGQALPLPTRMLIGVSSFMSNYWWILLSLILLLFFVIRRFFFSTPEGKILFDRLRLKIPLIGKVIRKVEVSTFARTLGTLLENGVAILPSLKIIQSTIRNQAIVQEISRTYEEVTKGSKLAESLAKSPYFYPIEVNMIAIGEESGQVENMLSKVAQTYDQDIDRSVKILTSLLEPLMIIILGGFVGFIVFSILLPIFQVNVLIK